MVRTLIWDINHDRSIEKKLNYNGWVANVVEYPMVPSGPYFLGSEYRVIFLLSNKSVAI